ncbi:MAG: hypothetical protein J6K29_04750 [Clostridia bacterium]|nr:hypothetical protein [Clostridia bacterium]
MKLAKLTRVTLALLLAIVMLVSAVACTPRSGGDETDSGTSTETPSGNDTSETTSETTSENTSADTLPEDVIDEHTYDFYITLGTMPTLYATLNAYARQNPNTYMWFLRGNTISHEYTADFIHYFDTQSTTNANSSVDWSLIRNKVKEILAADPEARFHLYCDDLRVSFIPHIFVWAGVDFEDLRVTFLSDGTGTYNNYSYQTDAYYDGYDELFEEILTTYENGRENPDFTPTYADDDGVMMALQYIAFYVSTFPNVDFWVQSPDYLQCGSAVVAEARKSMHIVAKNPAEMYANLPDDVRAEYQKVVLANALVDSETLTTLEEAVSYFDNQLSGRNKELVLILGTNKKTLAENKFYIDETLKYYTPTPSAVHENAVVYKGQLYEIEAGAETVNVNGTEMKIGECGVYLFFKGHPAFPADEELQAYFADHGIEILPHRTPVETLFWMYDVKVGGFQSTSFLSCYKGQTEFIYEQPTAEAIVQMMEAGFFNNVAIFEAPTEEDTSAS